MPNVSKATQKLAKAVFTQEKIFKIATTELTNIWANFTRQFVAETFQM